MSTPIRVLHVVGSMNRGGTETWLMNVLRHIDRSQFQFSFLTHHDREDDYDKEIVELGARKVVIPRPHELLSYSRAMFAHIRDNEYDVVHTHLHFYNGVVLPISFAAGVKTRISHSHSSTGAQEKSQNLLRKAYASSMRKSISQFMTHGIAVGREAASCLFGEHFISDARVSVLHCGIETEPFLRSYSRSECRAEFGIPMNAKVVGHVGRFEEPKNHEFLVSAVSKAMFLDPQVWLLLVGDGSLRDEIQQNLAALGMSARTVVTGVRSDIPRILCAGMDAFVFPSKWEGLPLSLVEAQAAGLPCISSDAITTEAILFPELVNRLPLQAGAEYWANGIISALHRGRGEGGKYAQLAGQSSFDIFNSIDTLAYLYRLQNGRVANVTREAA